jgi:titin
VRWTAPVDLGGARTIRDYTVEWSAHGADWQSKTITDTWTMLFDLINGTRYRVRVAARGSGGQGEWTTLEPGVRPRTTPDRPTAVTATGGTNSLTIGWNPGGTGGAPIRSYRIRWTGPDGVTQEQVVDGSLRTMTVTTIPGETTVTVAAINSSGVGRAARATTTVWSQDITKPQGIEVGATSQGFQLTWTAPAVTDGLSGTAIAIRFVDGTGQPMGDWKLVATMPATDTSATLGAVTGSRAIFRLRSLRRDGATSAWTPATPARMATAARPLPVSLAFTHDGESRTAQAFWSPVSPDTVGALNVTGYEAQYRQPGSTSWTAITGQSPVDISTAAWADGTATLRVRSLLGTRHSEWATATVAITTSVPGPPTAANATGGVGTITVTWTPGTTGGTPITGVKVRYRTPSTSVWTAEVDLPSADVAAGTSTLSGMGAGSWEVQIAMVNTKGTGIWVPAGAVTTT